MNTNLRHINGLTYNDNELSSSNKIIELPAVVKLDGYKFVVAENAEVNKTLPDENNYIGYYADINADGEVDGVIFADLVKGSSKGIGQQQWIKNSGTYTIPSSLNADGFKSYYISKENYRWANTEESKPVLSPIGTGNDRFYIMSLNDFTTEAYIDENDSSNNYPAYTTYYYFFNAYGKMNENYTKNNFGKGRENTQIMIEKWNLNGETGIYDGATQNNGDIWKHIQTQLNSGWFIPSKEEWAAFGNELNITGDNCRTIYNLNTKYMTSSIASVKVPYWAALNYSSRTGIDTNYFGNGSNWYVRLATTF